MEGGSNSRPKQVFSEGVLWQSLTSNDGPEVRGERRGGRPSFGGRPSAFPVTSKEARPRDLSGGSLSAKTDSCEL